VFVEAGHRAVRDHQVGQTVTSQVHELRLPASQGEVRLGGAWLYNRNLSPINVKPGNGGARIEAEFAPVDLVAALRGDDAGDALAVQICPTGRRRPSSLGVVSY
jgi:hypothetical protein